MKPKILQCSVCLAEFTRRVSKQHVTQQICCSIDCKLKAEAPTQGEFHCSKCHKSLQANEFDWYRDVRYAAGWRRCPLCRLCQAQRSRSYHTEHKDQVKAQHQAWRQKGLNGSEGLRFWFARQLGSYRKRARDAGVPFDLTLDDLVYLYEQQEGKCYYTGESITWLSNKLSPNSMTVDRLSPSSGYIAGNVVLCRFLVNTMKNALTEEQFYDMCQHILDVRKKRHETSLDHRPSP